MDAIDRLVLAVGKLPGIGRRSAERIALKLVRDRDGLLHELVEALEDAAKNVVLCSFCGNVTTSDHDPCRFCTSAERDGTVLCVVEDPADILLVERAGVFHGRYHALMGRISPARGDGPGNLRFQALIERIKKENVAEIMLALSTDVEGDATASYIIELLRGSNVAITRLASGLPAGSGVAYSDPLTLSRAIRNRTRQ